MRYVPYSVNEVSKFSIDITAVGCLDLPVTAYLCPATFQLLNRTISQAKSIANEIRS